MFQSNSSFETVLNLVFPGIAKYFPLTPELAWKITASTYWSEFPKEGNIGLPYIKSIKIVNVMLNLYIFPN